MPGGRMFSLGGRLALCASLVRPGSRLVDVGTDHAYLPVWLALAGRIGRAVAADVRPGPLARAERNIRKYGVEATVRARLSDGLDAVSPQEADDIVFAGMGGLLISRILLRTPWLRDPAKRLILQPMTSVEELRRSLSEQGFAVLRERAACEDGHVYTAMLCGYDPANRMTGRLYPYVGRISADTPENRLYLARRMAPLKKRADGLRREGDRKAAEELDEVRGRIAAMLGRPEESN